MLDQLMEKIERSDIFIDVIVRDGSVFRYHSDLNNTRSTRWFSRMMAHDNDGNFIELAGIFRRIISINMRRGSDGNYKHHIEKTDVSIFKVKRKVLND